MYADEGINAESLAAGLYMVQVVLENNKQVYSKLIKE